MDYAGTMNSCDSKAQRLGLAALTETERIVVLVSRANFEIELGGFTSFYYNSAGDLAVESAAALDAVGAFKAAAALRAGNAMFPGGPPVDRQRRYEVLLSLDDGNRFGVLGSEFYAENPDVFSRLCSFIEENRLELQGHAEER